MKACEKLIHINPASYSIFITFILSNEFCATGRFEIPEYEQKPHSFAPDASFIIIV